LNENIDVYADRNMVKVILFNLISNAIKFTPQNGQIKIRAKDLNSDYILIQIDDTGVGIAETMLQKLNKQHRIQSSSGTDGEKGSGLGLQICFEFVHKHGGQMWAESISSGGTRFTFTLPHT
jgi:two-component system, sensor histidine kinase and response regulator